jgi:hypothetical protein
MSEIPELSALLNTLSSIAAPQAGGVVVPGAYTFRQTQDNWQETDCVPTRFHSALHGEFVVRIKIGVGIRLHTGHVVTAEEAADHAAHASALAATAITKLLDWGKLPSQASKAFKDYTKDILQHEHPTYGYRVEDCHGR